MHMTLLINLILMLIITKTLTSNSWVLNVGDTLDEMKEWLVENTLETAKIVENNMKISKELVDSSFVGEFVQDTSENVNDIAKLVKGSLEVARDQVVESYIDMLEDINVSVDLRTSRAQDVITQLYSNFNSIGQFVPDFSPLISLCTVFSQCSDCSLPLVLCRLCCPQVSEAPITIEDWAEESHSSSSILSLLSSSFSLAGLHLVYQNWLDPRKPNNAATHSVIGFINKFQQLAGNTNFINASGVTSISSLPPSELCGYFVSGSRNRRIMGGKNVKKLGAHPWQLSMATSIMGIWYQHRCGAAIITRHWALSAAHCVQSFRFTTSLYLMGGFLHISKRQTAQIRRVDKIIPHPQFNEVSYEQDIALLHMNEPLVLTTKVLPICLPLPSSDYVGKLGTLAGWGKQGHYGDAARRLQYVGLPIISNDECMEWFNKTGSKQWIPYNTFFCAGWEEGSKDACSGDSGGPLTVTRDDGRVEIAGVVSWGIGCGKAGRPGVYTRVTNYLGWIDDIIRHSES